MITETIAPTCKPPKGTKIHLMLTCIADAFYPDVGKAVVECLESSGYGVAFDDRQTCCCQPAFNSGDRDSAIKVARYTIDLFQNVEALVVPSGSCAAMIRWGYPQLFEGQSDYERAVALAEKTYEFHEFLVQVADQYPWPGQYERNVVLHRSCHMRELHCGDLPEQLLRSIKGLNLLDMPTPEQCCGFGGTFAVTFPWVSKEIGLAKIDSIQESSATEVVSTDMSCLMHLQGLQSRLDNSGPSIPMRHVSQVLRDSLE